MADNKQDDFNDDEYQFEADDVFQFEDDDDEFQFAEDDELREEGELGSTGSNYLNDFMQKVKDDGIQKHLVTFIIGLVVIGILLFSLYKLYSVFFGASPEPSKVVKVETPIATQSTTQIIETKPATTVVEETAQPIDILPIPEAAPVTPSPAVFNDQSQQLASMQNRVLELTKRLDELEKSNSLLLQSMNMVQSQATTAMSRIENLDKGVNNIQSQVMKIGNALGKILETSQKPSSTIFVNQERTQSPIQRIQHNPPEVENEAPVEHRIERIVQGEPIRKEMMGVVQPMIQSFYVQALIPGRAWLKDNSGKIFTVTIGDLVPGYGKIVEINPEDGYVLTESGNKVEYGIDQY